MAQIDRFMIAPINIGLQTDVRPWLIPDDAFSSLLNAYIFRGRVRKRFGSYLMNTGVDASIAQLYSRLRINIGTTNGAGTAAGNVPGAQFHVGQMFSIDTQIYTVNVAGTPAAMLNTGAGAATYNTNTGAYTFAGAPINTTIYFYPAQPVMGFVTYESDLINDEPVYAFDTQFAYQFTSGAWERLSAGSSVWTGTNAQFFWGSTYRGLTNADYFLFVTNFNAPDVLRYWDGAQWNELSPVLGNGRRLLSARIIVPFKDRLVCLNTVENDQGTNIGTTNGSTGNFGPAVVPGGIYEVGQNFVVGTTVYTVISSTPGPQAMQVNTLNPNNPNPPTATFDITTGTVNITGNGNNVNRNVYFVPLNTTGPISYVNRCSFSQNGSPVNANAWIQSIAGKGGYIDAPTKEQIVTSEFLKDRLIVYFESSTWELVYTGNEILPFRWQQINTELGAESTFSSVPFDKVVLAIGNVGVHACNGANVERIDQKIPDSVFEISNDNEGVFRVYGIRDYFVELAYWTFPSEDRSRTYPNRVLVYNYKTGSWAFNRDSITAFGYYQKQDDITWETISTTWEQSIEPWASGTLQSQFRQIIAGNQEGFVFVVDSEVSRNAPSLQISDISAVANQITITAIDHNLDSEDYVVIENAQGVNGLNGNIYEVQTVTTNTFTILEDNFTGAYTGGGTVGLVSNIDIKTKQYNFYVDQGRNAMINKVDFYVDKTAYGEITVDYFISSSEQSSLSAGQATGAILGTGALETYPYALAPFEAVQDRLWHPIYPIADGECIQLRLYMSDDQIRDINIAWSDFEMHAMTFYTSPTASRLQ